MLLHILYNAPMKKFIFISLLFLTLVACSPGNSSLEDAIIGTWENPSGFQVQFYSGGAGFFPGVPEHITDSDFAYTIVDQNHLVIDFQGEKFTIEIYIEGDTLTWKDSLGEVIYQQVK